MSIRDVIPKAGGAATLPWNTFSYAYKVGTEVEGKVVRIIEKGVIVELPMSVDGFVSLSQLSLTPVNSY